MNSNFKYKILQVGGGGGGGKKNLFYPRVFKDFERKDFTSLIY